MQVMNEIYLLVPELKKELLATPIGIIPAGSQNSTSGALGAMTVNQAICNILKGKTLKADFMEVMFVSSGVKRIATQITWGDSANMNKRAEGKRGCC